MFHQIACSILAALLVAAASSASLGQTPVPGSGVPGNGAPATEVPAPPSPMDPPQGEAKAPAAFAAEQAAVNLFAIRSAELALDRTSNRRITDLARQLIEGHQKAQQELGNAVRAQSLPGITPKLNPGQEQKLQAMREAPDTQFDNVFLSAQLVEHQAALDSMALFSAGGSGIPLKAYAEAFYPTLRTHFLIARTASAP